MPAPAAWVSRGRTEEAYISWIRRFIRANGLRHPRVMGAGEVERFLTDLAVRRQVAASTQNQALSALLFLYRDVLGIDLPWLQNVQRARRPERIPVVLDEREVQAVLDQMDCVTWLAASLLYGSGLRLLECLRLRIQDIDFARREITVRHGKGGKDRRTILPERTREPLNDHLLIVRRTHERDLAMGAGNVLLPDALADKYPNARQDWRWQWVFPARRRYRPGPLAGAGRHHLHESVLNRGRSGVLSPLDRQA